MNIIRRKRFLALDWAAASLIVGLGLMLFLPGDSLAGPTCGPLIARAPEVVWAYGLTIVGALRIAALIINGRMRRGSPLLRLIGGVLGAWIWSQFFTGSLEFSFRVGVPTPDLAYTLFLMICEIGLCVRATLQLMRAVKANEPG